MYHNKVRDGNASRKRVKDIRVSVFLNEPDGKSEDKFPLDPIV